MKFNTVLTTISLTLFLGFSFVALTLFSIYSPNWQNEYNRCLQRNDFLAANCINEKRQKWWQFDLLYKNGSIGNPKYDKSLKEQGLVK